jgi:hydrogenase maturation protease
VILVAGIGNIFLGDDAFGSHVARRMLEQSIEPNVRVVDFGIRGLGLAYALTEGCDAVIIVDTFARGGEAGTLYVVEPDVNEIDRAVEGLEAHAMDPARVLALARSMGAQLRNVCIVGCEPETFEPNEEMDLSPRVAAAVDPAIEIIQTLIEEFLPKEAIV